MLRLVNQLALVTTFGWSVMYTCRALPCMMQTNGPREGSPQERFVREIRKFAVPGRHCLFDKVEPAPGSRPTLLPGVLPNQPTVPFISG